MQNNKIKYCAYIQSWNDITNVEKNVLKIEQEFIKHNKDYRIINSSNNIYKKENWINVGAIWYHRSFYEALKDFDFSNDYFLYITGDFKSSMWKEIFEKSDYVLNKYLPKSFSLHHDPPYLTSEKISLGNVKNEKCFEYSTIQDGIIVFYHKDVVKELIEYFSYIDNQGLLKDMKFGWGIDYVAAAICFYQKGYMIKDKGVYGINSSSGFANSDVKKCMEEWYTTLNSFKDFSKIKGNEKEMSFILKKIKQRVGFKTPMRYLNYEDFYEKE